MFRDAKVGERKRTRPRFLIRIEVNDGVKVDRRWIGTGDELRNMSSSNAVAEAASNSLLMAGFRGRMRMILSRTDDNWKTQEVVDTIDLLFFGPNSGLSPDGPFAARQWVAADYGIGFTDPALKAMPSVILAERLRKEFQFPE